MTPPIQLCGAASAERAEIRRRYLAVETATIADVLDELNVVDQGLSPRFHALSGEGLAGWAYTIRGVSGPAPRGGDPAKMTACNGISPYEVAVWAGDGLGFAYFGELIATGMVERGCVGALVQGAARDVKWLKAMGFPCVALAPAPIQSIGRWCVDAYQISVELPGATVPKVTVRPGDFIRADRDGTIVVPAELTDQVLRRAEDLTATEVKIRAELAAGATLSEVLDRYGHV